MNKILLGLMLGGVLGIFDGLSALISAPEVRPEIMTIVLGSMTKGLFAGAIIGWFARVKNNLPLGIIVGLLAGGLCALPFAMGARSEHRPGVLLGNPHSRRVGWPDCRILDAAIWQAPGQPLTPRLHP